MKTLAILALVLSTLAAGTAAQAQDRQVTVYNGPVAIELPASLLRGSAPAVTATGETPPARKVRIVMPSPYGN